MVVLRPVCGRLCELICGCLWYVPRIVLGAVWPDFSLFKSCLDCFLDSLWPFLWPSCGRFCGMICECLWPVQRSVLGAVWIKKIWFMDIKGLFELFKNGLWLVCG